jgi:hypothetical protein
MTSAVMTGMVVPGAVTDAVMACGAGVEGGDDQGGGAEGYRGDEDDSGDHEPEQPRDAPAVSPRFLWPLGAGIGVVGRGRRGVHDVGLLSVRCSRQR